MTHGFFGYFFRSVLVVAVSLIFDAGDFRLCAYPLSRMKFKLRGFIYAGIVAMMSIPMHVTLIPIFKMTTNMGLYDSLQALVGPYVTFALPMSVFILTAFMTTIPKEIEESAEIDGCNKFRNFFRHHPSFFPNQDFPHWLFIMVFPCGMNLHLPIPSCRQLPTKPCPWPWDSLKENIHWTFRSYCPYWYCLYCR